MGKGLARFVEQAIAEPPAEDDAGHGDPGDVVGDGVAAQEAPAAPRLPAEADEEDVEPGEVGQAVIPDAPLVAPEAAPGPEERMRLKIRKVGEEVQGGSEKLARLIGEAKRSQKDDGGSNSIGAAHGSSCGGQ